MELLEVDLVGVAPTERDHVVEPETPEDLGRKIGGPGLGRHSCGLDHPFENDDHLWGQSLIK